MADGEGVPGEPVDLVSHMRDPDAVLMGPGMNTSPSPSLLIDASEAGKVRIFFSPQALLRVPWAEQHHACLQFHPGLS